MDDSNRVPLADQEPTLLFEEYVAAIDAGERVDVDELVRRAGGRGSDLRRRLIVFQALQELSDTLQPLADVDDPAGGGAPGEESPFVELGRFQNLVQIGHGASSRVLLANDPKLARRVALKVFSPGELGVRDARAWMKNEGRSLARLEHPGVVRVFDLDEADGHAYIEMEYVRGPSLRAVLDRLRSQRESSGLQKTDTLAVDREAAQTPSTATAAMAAWTKASALALDGLPARVRLASKLARALYYCHGQGVIHRDIKPGNVLLADACEPRLIDFGLAHSGLEDESLNQVTQRLVGTPAYLAPEQVDGSRTGASPASDQFSLGTLLYELFTLQNPFQKPTRDETLRAISRADARPLRKVDAAIPSDLERIVLHCLERSPKNRYPSVGALADDIDAFLELRAISLQPPSPAKLLRLWVARNRRDVVLGVIGLIVLAVALFTTWIVDAVKRRNALAASIEIYASRIDDLRTHQDIEQVFPLLHELNRSAGDLDSEATATFLGRHEKEHAHALLDACSKRLSVLMESELAAISALADFDRRAAKQRILSTWDTALGMDLAYCPECEYNRRAHERGCVDLPLVPQGRVLQLLRYMPTQMPMIAVLSTFPPSNRLPAGLYRCQMKDAAGELTAEADFEVDPAVDRYALELRPLRSEIKRDMIRIGESTLPFPKDDLRVRPFWVQKHPVRWSDLRLGLEESVVMDRKRHFEKSLEATLDMEDPAILRYEDAQRFAHAVGARIPTLGEMLAALQNPEVETPSEDRTVCGELITGLLTQRLERFLVPYSVRNKLSRKNPPPIPAQLGYDADLTGRSTQGKKLGYTFRLAFDDGPEASNR
jgi:serine/threonine protein kinase